MKTTPWWAMFLEVCMVVFMGVLAVLGHMPTKDAWNLPHQRNLYFGMLGSAGLVAQDFFGRKCLHAVGHATQCIRAISGFIFLVFFVCLVLWVYG
jgi:hypothetical protein